MQKLPDLLKATYEKELYNRWLTLYPFMELGISEYISFDDYKNKAFKNSISKKSTISDEEINNEMIELVKYYEQKKAGEKVNGNI